MLQDSASPFLQDARFSVSSHQTLHLINNSAYPVSKSNVNRAFTSLKLLLSKDVFMRSGSAASVIHKLT